MNVIILIAFLSNLTALFIIWFFFIVPIFESHMRDAKQKVHSIWWSIDSVKYCISVLKGDHLLYLFFFSMFVLTMSDVHIILGLYIWFVIFFVICFLFSWTITTYLFYPYSVRSCLLEAIVQLLLNHGSYICFFVLESCLKYKMIHN